jgi:D-xylose reductase
VEPIARKQLADWGLDYFDLYYMHFPIALKYVDPAEIYPPGWMGKKDHLEFSNATIQETWQAMESLVDKKLTRSIGISNFSAQLIMDLLRYARIRPATLQIEHHPYLVQKGLIKYVQKEGLTVTAYSSFGPMSFIELDLPDAKTTPLLFNQDVIRSIAQKHGKTPAQVLLRWSTQRNIAVIPKSDLTDHLLQNRDVTGWDLEEGELEALDGLDKNLHFNDPISVCLPLWIFHNNGSTKLSSLSSFFSTDSMSRSSYKEFPLRSTTLQILSSYAGTQ